MDYERWHLDHSFVISQGSDLEDMENYQALFERAIQDAKTSKSPVKFEIWKKAEKILDDYSYLPEAVDKVMEGE